MRRSKFGVLLLASCCFSLVSGQLEEANFLENLSADSKETELLIEAVISSSVSPQAEADNDNSVPGNSTEKGDLSKSLSDLPVSSVSPTSFTIDNSSTKGTILDTNINLSSLPNISKQLDQQNEDIKRDDLRTPVLGDCITDTLFVVDSTTSVAKIFAQHKEYITKVVDLLNISTQGSHISLLVYSGKLRHRVTYHFGANQEQHTALKKVQELPFLGGVTSTGVALDHAFIEITNTRRSNETVVNVVIVTDGFSYDPVDVQSQNLRQLPKVRTFAVTVGDMKSESELLILAGRPENLFQGPGSYIDLVEQLTTCEPDALLSNSLDKNGATAQQSRNDIGQINVPVGGLKTSSGGAKTSSGQVQIDPSSRSEESGNNKHNPLSDNDSHNLQWDAHGSYSEEQCASDVVFVIDASGSLRERYEKQLEMVTTLFEVLPSLPAPGHISVVKFSGRGRSRVILPLSNTLTKEEIKKVIVEMPFFGGTTFTNEALEKAISQLENSTISGDKNQIVIVFTDGFSFDDPTTASKTLHDMGVSVLAVAFNDQFPVDRNQLEVLTRHKDEHIFMNSDHKKLKQKLRQLTQC